MSAPKVSSRAEVLKTPYFTLMAKRLDGATEGAPYYSLALPDYVTIVPVTPRGRVILIRQFRPAIEAVTLELPAGLVDPGDTPEQTARRELLEETGYAAERVTAMGRVRPDHGRLENWMWVFFVTTSAEPRQPAEEGVEVVTAAPDELSRWIADGTFHHAQHIAAALLAAHLGHLSLPRHG